MKKRGFTLIEVIVAIVIIAIMIGIFASITSSYLAGQKKTRGITKDTMLQQEKMEQLIKQEKQSPDGDFQTLNNVFVNGVQVQVKNIKVEGRYHRYYTAVTKKKLPTLEAPRLLWVNAQLKVNHTDASIGYATSETTVMGSYGIDPKTFDQLLAVNKYWYISRDGFNIPVPESYDESEVGIKYPYFPDDYYLAPIDNKDEFLLAEEAAGKHVVFAVSPAGKNGKIGETLLSRPVFISALPLREPLILHLDASYEQGTGDVAVWKDLSVEQADSYAINASSQPSLTEVLDDTTFVAKRMIYETTDRTVSTYYNLGRHQLTSFVLVNQAMDDQFLSIGSSYRPYEKISIDGSFYLYIIYRQTNNSYQQKIALEGAHEYCEVLVYDKDVDGDEKQQIINYFKNKYKTVNTSDYQIVSLEDVEATVYQNEPYVLPNRAIGIMENGRKKSAPVVWKDVVDTSLIGTVTVAGHLKGDESIPIVLRLTVLPYVAVESLTATPTLWRAEISDTKMLNVELLPSNATNPTLTYESSNDAVVSVDETGLMTAIAFGIATVNISSADGVTTSCLVEVLPNSLLADAVLHLDASKSESIVVDAAGNMVQWNDCTVHGRDFKTGTGNRYPEFIEINGHHAVYFKEASMYYQGPSIGGVTFDRQNKGDSTIIVVMKNTASSLRDRVVLSQNRFFTSNGRQRNNIVFGLINAGNLYQRNIIKLSNYDVLDQYYDVNASKIIQFIRHDASRRIDSVISEGAGVGSKSANVRNSNYRKVTPNIFLLGMGPDYYMNNNYYMEGYIYEVLMFNRSLTNDEILLLNQWLEEKWF